MKLIEDLGTRFYTDKSTRKHRFGLYECSECMEHFICSMVSAKRGNINKCNECSYKERALRRIIEASKRFAEEASITHNNKYDYRLVVYLHSKTKVVIICPVHGEFMQTPSDHKSGYGCAKCTGSEAMAKNAASRFIGESNIIHEFRYDYSLVEYVNSYTQVNIVCKDHGVFEQVPSNHKRGSGCPLCSISGFDKSKSAILYYLKVTYGSTFVYKIGITNLTVKTRFNNTDLAKIQVLKTWDFPLGADAYNKEQEILKLYKEFRYIGAPLLSSGNTELFTFDILGLDYTA